jgi:hypothetical protein
MRHFLFKRFFPNHQEQAYAAGNTLLTVQGLFLKDLYGIWTYFSDNMRLDEHMATYQSGNSIISR